MHESDFDISIEGLSKIEGHANLTVKVRKDRVIDARLEINECKRFYTQAIRGKPYSSLPQMVSRICGTCSAAHLLCCTEAVEEAVTIQPSEQTMLLRKLAMYAAWIRDHAMHLYFFSLPDLLGKESALEFDGEEHELLHEALRVKGAGNKFGKLIGGRAVHPTNFPLGGILKLPKKEEAKEIIKELQEVRPLVLKLIELFHNSKQEFHRETHFAAVINNDYSYCGEEIMVSDGLCINEDDYFDYLRRIVLPYSTATGYELEGHAFMVGALARMNLNRESLHRETKKDAAKFLKAFPSENIFRNNLAQAIEILHSIDSSCEILEGADFKEEAPAKPQRKAGVGIAAVEAPRGILFYMVDVGEDGLVRDGTLVIPTQQNQINMEQDMKALVQAEIKKDREEIRKDLEALIRAYDPCMSCASHFLRIKWVEK